MSYQSKIKRLYLIVEKINNSTYKPTKLELLEYLNDEGIKGGERTFERDKQALRDEFGIEVVVDKNYQYHIDKDKSDDIEGFLKFINTAITTDIIVQGLRDYADLRSRIQMGSSARLTGLGQLKELVYAVSKNRVIHFDHKAYYREESRPHIVLPYLLKEYIGRWYVVGLETDINEIRVFGIDRISNLNVSSETFRREPSNEADQIFKNNIGIDYTYTSAVEQVVLKFTTFQANYIKSQPWHTSQQILEETKDHCLLQLEVIPNYELFQRILMNADQVEVLKPDWVREEVSNLLEKTLKKYQS